MNSTSLTDLCRSYLLCVLCMYWHVLTYYIDVYMWWHVLTYYIDVYMWWHVLTYYIDVCM